MVEAGNIVMGYKTGTCCFAAMRSTLLLLDDTAECMSSNENEGYFAHSRLILFLQRGPVCSLRSQERQPKTQTIFTSENGGEHRITYTYVPRLPYGLLSL